MLFLCLLHCGLLQVVLCSVLSWSDFLYRVFWTMRDSFGRCLHLSRMLCGYYLSFWVFSVCLGFHLLPPPCSSIGLPCCHSPCSTSSCLYLILLLGVFPFGWFPLFSFFLISLWLFFLGIWSLLSLSPILGRPLVREGLSLLPWLNLQFPPRRGPPFGPSQLLFGFFALLLVRLSFALMLPLSMSASSCFYTTPFQSAVPR